MRYPGAMDKRTSSSQKKRKTEFKFIDLFSGIGGMRLGFEAAGGKCVYSSEWDEYCKKTYEANFGSRPDGDITKVDAKQIPDHDILVGGFPCQPFSIAGVSKKNSLGRKTGFEDETQGTLFFDDCRILKEKKPPAFVLENVKNIKSHDHGNTWRVILESLEDLNYDVVFKDVIDGQNYVPQHRERVFIIGFRRDLEVKDFTIQVHPVEPKPLLRDIMEPEVDAKYTISEHLWNYLQERKIKQRAKGNGFGYSLAYPAAASIRSARSVGSSSTATADCCPARQRAPVLSQLRSTAVWSAASVRQREPGSRVCPGINRSSSA